MTKEEYVLKLWKDIDEMPIEALREYAKRIEANSQSYFHNWKITIEELESLRMELNKLKSKNNGTKEET